MTPFNYRSLASAHLIRPKPYMLSCLLAFFSIITFVPVQAQESEIEKPIDLIDHRIYLELAGNGGFYSFNYEYGLTERLSARGGFEIFPLGWTENTGTVLGFPLMLNYRIYSFKNHHFLAGAGTLLATNAVVTATGMLAYELHVANKSMLRLGFTPHMIEGSLEPWGGLSVGFIF